MERLRTLFGQWAGVACDEVLAIGAQGSSRRYYRLVGHAPGGRVTAMGCIGDNLLENKAFFAFSRHLAAKGMPVPELYAVDDEGRCYLQQDLGDLSLYGLLVEKRRRGLGFDAEMLGLYRHALSDLAALQQAGADMDFSVAYPCPSFDRQAIMWDLNYFKYHFLKLAHVPFDEQLLEADFRTLADLLLSADTDYMLYRDFQSRNIMVTAPPAVAPRADAPPLHYIDYQGARRGAAQYDVASLLYSAKSDLPEPVRRSLVDHYLDVRAIKGQERKQWMHLFWAYLLVRQLQTLGAYGYRGLYERKDYFLQSIPLALANLRRLAEDHADLFAPLPHLQRVVATLASSAVAPVAAGAAAVGLPPAAQARQGGGEAALTVRVLSFSFKQGLPDDPSGNGGGFVFDCRALPNPGRYPEYKAYTGKDRPVAEFLQKEPAVDSFLDHAKALVAQSVDKYLERRFTHLQVAFGCTGGQHRSVYCAERLAAWLCRAYPACNVVVAHREQD